VAEARLGMEDSSLPFERLNMGIVAA